MSRIRANTITNQNANGAPNFPDGITVTGIVTATTINSNVTGDLTVSGNIGVGGTLTYEDVTNVDAIGIITARSGIKIGATGANTLISGNSTGIGIGDASPTKPLTVGTTTPVVLLDDQSSRTLEVRGPSASNSATVLTTSSHDLLLGTNNAERLRIGTAGQLGIGGANYGTDGQVLTSKGASAAIQWTTLEGGKVRNYKYQVDSGYSAANWGSFTQVASFSYTPLQSTSKIIVIASLNLLWESSNVHTARMKFGSNSYQQFDKVAKAASISGWLSGNPTVIFDLGTAGNTSSNAVILELQGSGSHTSYFNYSSGDSQFLLLEMAPAG
tara:strand:+ start:284 stop:1267 length:984 start_codon:yes stop_codon:yes gene_type:complete